MRGEQNELRDLYYLKTKSVHDYNLDTVFYKKIHLKSNIKAWPKEIISRRLLRKSNAFLCKLKIYSVAIITFKGYIWKHPTARFALNENIFSRVKEIRWASCDNN